MVDQLRQGVQHRQAQIDRRGTDRLEDGQVDAAAKDRAHREQPLRRLAQHLVAPGDRGAQRPLPIRHIPATADQQAQGVLQPGQDRRRRQQLHPCGRQFDRQRQPVEGAMPRLHDTALTSVGAQGRRAPPVPLVERIERKYLITGGLTVIGVTEIIFGTSTSDVVIVSPHCQSWPPSDDLGVRDCGGGHRHRLPGHRDSRRKTNGGTLEAAAAGQQIEAPHGVAA